MHGESSNTKITTIINWTNQWITLWRPCAHVFEFPFKCMYARCERERTAASNACALCARSNVEKERKSKLNSSRIQFENDVDEWKIKPTTTKNMKYHKLLRLFSRFHTVFYDYIHALTICHIELKRRKKATTTKRKMCKEQEERDSIHICLSNRILGCPPNVFSMPPESAYACVFVCARVVVFCTVLQKIFQRFFNDCNQREK